MVGMLGMFDTIVTFIMSKRLRITDIVKATGLSKSTLIRYEENGTLARPKRDGRKWRYYSIDDCKRIVATLKEKNLI
jgi:DNA-binding transcriptional MerR regulator